MIIILVGFTLAKMGMAFLVKNFQAYTQTDERLLHIPHCTTDTAESKNTLEELAAHIEGGYDFDAGDVWVLCQQKIV